MRPGYNERSCGHEVDRRSACSAWSGLPATFPTDLSHGQQADRGHGARPRIPSWSSSTSRPPVSTPPRANCSASTCGVPHAACRCSSSTTTWDSCSTCATTFTSSTSARHRPRHAGAGADPGVIKAYLEVSRRGAGLLAPTSAASVMGTEPRHDRPADRHKGPARRVRRHSGRP